MIKIGSSVIYTLDEIHLRCKVIGHVEGWYHVKFWDESSAIVRPSRIRRVA